MIKSFDSSFPVLVETLEHRIAPANLLLGITGQEITKNGESVRNDALGAAYGVDTAVFLAAGDFLFIDGSRPGILDKTDAPLMSVSSGFAWVFFDDRNGNSIWERDEITGVAFGAAPAKSFEAKIETGVHGSIVGNATQFGILPGDDLSVTAVTSLTVSGEVSGRLLAGGSIKNVTILGASGGFSIAGIEAGTAAIETDYSFGESVSFLDSFSIERPSGIVGSSISHVFLAGGTNRIEAGNGFAGDPSSKPGGRGGFIDDVIIANGGGSEVTMVAGTGGDGGPRGGNGGYISNITAAFISSFAAKAGDGGQPGTGSAGGSGGSISDIEFLQIATSMDIVLHGGAGGISIYDDGTAVGAAGDISHIRAQAPSGDIFLSAFTDDGPITSKGGGGGNISDIFIGTRSGTGEADVTLRALGSISQVVIGVEADFDANAGGSISKLRLAGGVIHMETAYGNDENPPDGTPRPATSSGSISDIVSTGFITGEIITGNGGNGYQDPGGDGANAGDRFDGGDSGSISNLKFAEAGDLLMRTGDAGEAGYRGEGSEGKGGTSGSIFNITMDTASNLSFEAGAGGASSGSFQGGAGGFLEKITVKSGVSGNIFLTAGRGGDYSGGAGGWIRDITMAVVDPSVPLGEDGALAIRMIAGDGCPKGEGAGGKGGAISDIALNFLTSIAHTLVFQSGVGGSEDIFGVSGDPAGKGGDISGIKISAPGNAIRSVILAAATDLGHPGEYSGNNRSLAGSIRDIRLDIEAGDDLATVDLMAGNSISNIKVTAPAHMTVLAGKTISTFRLAGGSIDFATVDVFNGELPEGRSYTAGNSGSIRDIVSTGVLTGSMTTGAGGLGVGRGAGGYSGSISDLTFATVDSLVLTIGEGGDGGDRGRSGSGGSISNVTIDKAMNLTFHAGDAGDASSGQAGNGGSITGLNVKTGLGGGAFIRAGQSGTPTETAGNVTGGNGGSIKDIRIKVIDAFPITEGGTAIPVENREIYLTGGVGCSSIGRGVGGNGGTVSNIVLDAATSEAPSVRIHSGFAGYGSYFNPEFDQGTPGGKSGDISSITLKSLSGSNFNVVHIRTSLEPAGVPSPLNGGLYPDSGNIRGITISTAGTLQELMLHTLYARDSISKVSVNAGGVVGEFNIETGRLTDLEANLQSLGYLNVSANVSDVSVKLGTGFLGNIAMVGRDEGGSITKLSISAGAPMGFIYLFGGRGSETDVGDIRKGGDGGSVSDFSLTTPFSTGLVRIYGGHAGDSFGRNIKGGAGGSVFDLTFNAPLANVFLDNSFARGDYNSGGTGGVGGSISHVRGTVGAISMIAGYGGAGIVYEFDGKNYGGKGGNGGSIKDIVLTNLGVTVGAIAPGAGGEGDVKDGKAGTVSKISIPGYTYVPAP